MRVAPDDDVIEASRRIDPISRSAKPFCQGEADAVARGAEPQSEANGRDTNKSIAAMSGAR
jgi:hypothetical protein